MTGNLLGGGLLTRLGGERRLGDMGDRLRGGGLPRFLRGDVLTGDLLLGGGEGDAGLLLGGVSPPRRRGGEFNRRRGDSPLRPIGDLLLGGD